MMRKFQIEPFAREVVKMKLTKLNFTVQNIGKGFNAVAPNGDKCFVLVRGRHRTAGPMESQEDESVKINLVNASRKHLLDNASPNTYLGVVVIKTVSERVEIIIAPFLDILKINGYFEFESDRRDICYVRMKNEYLSKYASMPNKLIYDSEPLSNWSDLYLKLVGWQPTPPPKTQEATDIASPPDRVQTHVYRILRDTEQVLRVKYLYRFECQICGHTIEEPNLSQ